MGTFIAILGVAAAVGTTGSWLPQVLRTFRTRSTGDFSWGYMCLFGGGVACWLAYGLLRHDPPLAAANLVTLVLFLGIVAIKWRTERSVSSRNAGREPVAEAEPPVVIPAAPQAVRIGGAVTQSVPAVDVSTPPRRVGSSP